MWPFTKKKETKRKLNRGDTFNHGGKNYMVQRDGSARSDDGSFLSMFLLMDLLSDGKLDFQFGSPEPAETMHDAHDPGPSHSHDSGTTYDGSAGHDTSTYDSGSSFDSGGGGDSGGCGCD